MFVYLFCFKIIIINIIILNYSEYKSELLIVNIYLWNLFMMLMRRIMSKSFNKYTFEEADKGLRLLPLGERASEA